jgi:predicted nucleic acid-binding protein
MTVHLDTSALVDALTGPRRSLGRLRTFVADGRRVSMSSIALYEWLRGPRVREELMAQERLFPREATVAFGAREASLAADLYRRVPKARGREIDLAIAACAIESGSMLWTLNPADFKDIPGLALA